jgi:cytoskeletal protein RodZ
LSQDVQTTSKYPRDRFDDVEPYTTQQGAHRKEFSTPKGAGQLNAIILAGGAALAIGVGSYLWLAPSDPLNMASPEPTETASEPVEEESAEPEPTAEESEEAEELVEPEPVEESEEPEPSPTPEPTEEETDEPDEAVDYSLPIGVYNASNIQGYASSVAQELGGAGFTVPIADNWSGNVPSQTTVYFSSDEATALAVAEEVGAVAVYEPSVDGVLVVLTAN